MGRPVNKNFIGDGAGKIQVTAVKFAAGGEILTESHITKQRSANNCHNFMSCYFNVPKSPCEFDEKCDFH